MKLIMKGLTALLLALAISTITIAGIGNTGTVDWSYSTPKPSSTTSSNLPVPSTSTPVSSCERLDSPGIVYGLSRNVSGDEVPFSPGVIACIVIAADGISLNLNGFAVQGGNAVIVNASNTRIVGPGTITAGLGPAVTIVNGTGNTVKDVTIAESFVGINILHSNGNLLEGNTMASAAIFGIRILGGTGNRIIGNKITAGPLLLAPEKLTGIMIADSPYSIMIGNSVEGAGNGIVLDNMSGESFIVGNRFSLNLQSGLVAFSGSNIILANEANNNTVNGISVASSSNILVFNRANNNGQRGIGLGNVCSASGSSLPSGYRNIVVLNFARGNSVDFFWDGQGTRNLWLFNSNNLQQIPTTPPTAALQC